METYGEWQWDYPYCDRCLKKVEWKYKSSTCDKCGNRGPLASYGCPDYHSLYKRWVKYPWYLFWKSHWEYKDRAVNRTYGRIL